MSNTTKARVFNIVQDKYHPESFTSEGELKEGAVPLLDERQIKIALAHKSIKRYGYIFHDKDTYSEKEARESWKRKAVECTENSEKEGTNEKKKKTALEWAELFHKASCGKLDFSDKQKEILRKRHVPLPGDLKNGHWHIVIECPNKVSISAVAKWFDIPENMIDIPRGRGAFLDCIQYLTHESSEQQALGKHRYSDEEVKANFDFRTELDAREERKIKYGKDLSKKEEFRYRVLYEGLTLRQLVAEDPLAYQDDYRTLDTLRHKYISTTAPMPTTRINFYVCGKGGVGKGIITRAIARAIYPEIKDDEDVFFEVGAKGSPFEGYDGQPVLIWHDRRAVDLLNELHGRGNVFNVFDSHPTRQKQNVKFSSIALTNTINIVDSVEDYEDFLDGLAGKYKDKQGLVHEAEDRTQSYRRFPFIIPVHEEDFTLLMNKGFFEGTREYLQYYEYANIRASFPKIAELCMGHPEAQRQVEGKALAPVTIQYSKLLNKVEARDSNRTDAEILEMFPDYGTQKNPSVRIVEIGNDHEPNFWEVPFETRNSETDKANPEKIQLHNVSKEEVEQQRASRSQPHLQSIPNPEFEELTPEMEAQREADYQEFYREHPEELEKLNDEPTAEELKFIQSFQDENMPVCPIDDEDEYNNPWEELTEEDRQQMYEEWDRNDKAINR